MMDYPVSFSDGLDPVMIPTMQGMDDIAVTIRPYCPADLAACRRLYTEGLIGGKIAENDTGFDIDDIDGSYMRSKGGCFFVADDESGEVVGMIGVQQHEESTGEIRRLRVRRDKQRRGVGSKLVEAAIKYCHDQGYLKITLDTFMDRAPAVKLFEKFRFRHNRTRSVNDKDLMYFYLDLYTSESRPSNHL